VDGTGKIVVQRRLLIGIKICSEGASSTP